MAKKQIKKEITPLKEYGEYLSTKETAEYLGMSYIWTVGEIRAGKLPAVKFGKSWKVSKTTLDEFMQEKSRKHLKSK